MSSEPRTGSSALELEHVSKVYDRDGRGLRWRQLLLLDERPRSPHRALDDVTLRVEPGEAVGLIGPNGAGKSTVLKLVAGVTRPTSGEVRPGGRVGSMIELAVGFHPELTGWENLRCGSLLRGTSRAELEPALEEIAAFAGIEDAMDMPLKKYSVGMRARLAFALATQFPVDLLAIDEVLAVGDTDFQVRCMDRIRAMVDDGTTLLFVSHEMRLISLMCDRVIRLDEGTVVDDGDAVDVVARYLKQKPATGGRSSDGPASIERYDLVPEVEPWGQIQIDAEIEVRRRCRRPTVSVAVALPTLNPDLVHVLASDRVRGLDEPGRYRVRGVSGPFGVTNLDLRMTLGVADGEALSDSADAVVRMTGDGSAWSYVALEPQWEIERESAEARHGGPAGRSARGLGGPPVVEVVDVVKAFRSGKARASLHAALPGRLGAPRNPDLRAIDHLSLEVERGEALGIIGPNGAGKSTLLRLIAGLTRADSGSVRVGGRVLPMLDFGSGMHPFMTGRENARVRARLLGMTAREAAARMGDIEEFADIGDAIDAPVHQYSTGMLTRLGFAVAIHAPGEILLIDELLAVGDEGFRQAALTAVEARRQTGNTVLFVSHEMALIEQVCSRVVRLVHGRVTDDGPVSELLDHPLGSSTPVGVHDATSGVRIHELQLRQRRVPVHGAIEFEGSIDVDEPAPHARLELSYRAVPDDRALVISSEDRNMRSFFIETLEPSGGALTAPGRYRFRCALADHPVTGTFDVVLAAIDDREGLVLAESRQEVLVGHHNPSGVPIPAATFTWTVEPIGP